eukprot:NODE_5616_length_991_cov_50.604839_g5040_i0.p1 GENE.NODE_5616_length_991_cov_50.604839_g5040_i0~~NODE_5616_length_991_cov_50.604839_g5040_i0.p1  ORF type:complete len:312 (-),score=62.62 NODE_5616_length_991_cov_50.604839_g5040_i0:54-932(-)
MIDMMSFLVRQFSEAETSMSAVERIAHYSQMEIEDYGEEREVNEGMLHTWPQYGQVEFVDVSARYREGLPRVLENITLKIPAGTKVGICGRTGSGKSSLLLALFRLLFPEKGCGRIIIDSIDTSTIPLQFLRSHLAIIPQDPVMFSGTVRRNLDPLSQHSEDKIWKAIEMAQLKSAINNLDDIVSENGDNFSVGQRQLFCLARAILRDSMVICLDEATAAVDQETDQMIQKLLRSAFSKQTIITIAHRIGTILDYDLVVVLDNGKLVEYGSPNQLLSMDGMFKSLVDARDRQ